MASVDCAADGASTVTFSVVATDNNDSGVEVLCTPRSGSRFRIGTNGVTCIATDAAGNTNSCSFQVIVQPPRVTIERAVIVRWKCGDVLQGADDIAGPWTDIPEAKSPYAVPETAARKFFRVRE